MVFKWDGKSRPTNDVYSKRWEEIFDKKKPNPVAKEVRTPKYKPRVVKAKKGKGSFTRKKEPDDGWSGIV
jgi:stalled ribosome alternative rescue factor ArfA